MDVTLLTIDAARSAIQERKTTATALAETYYGKIEKDDPQIGAYLTLSKERAGESCRIDGMAAKGTTLPPLAGVPVGIKDVMVTRGVRTTAGSKILGNYIPPYDCTAVSRLEAAGRGRAWQTELRRVCHGVVEREFRLEAGAQSPRYQPRSGRIIGGIGSRGGR